MTDTTTPTPISDSIARLRGAWDAGQAIAREREQAEATADLFRRDRARDLEPVVRQVPLHCRSPRGALVARIRAEIFQAVHAWAWGDSNLLLLGPTETGKTSAAAYLVRRLCAEAARVGGDAFERAKLIRWQECRELSAAAREHPLGQGAPEAIRRCQGARLLVLDDLGATDDAGALERVMSAREERGYPTVTTSGLRLREIRTTFGEALARRLAKLNGAAGRVVQAFPFETPKGPST